MENNNCANGDPPILAKFCPKDEYLTTFDMLQDECRNQAYDKAIRLLAAKPLDDHNAPGNATPVPRWLDIGTGSGLLASFVAAATRAPAPTAEAAPAATATATTTAPKGPEPAALQAPPQPTSIPRSESTTTKTEVHACEVVSEVADVAAETFAKNGGNVKLFRGRSTDMEVGRDLPARVPRVVSELLGTGLLEEGVLPTLRDAKTRLLSPGYVSIPHSANVWACCCESSQLHRMSRLLPSTVSGGGGGGVNGESFCAPSSERWARCPGTAGPMAMHGTSVQLRPLSPPVRIFEFDFSSRGRPLPGPEGRKRLVRFPIDAAAGGGVAHAIVCWWRCFMDEGRTIALSTSPRSMRMSPPEEGTPAERGEAGSSAAMSFPSRDHWRQSVYLLRRPIIVGPGGGAVRATAFHDDSTIWFDAIELEEEAVGVNHEAAPGGGGGGVAGGTDCADGADGAGTCRGSLASEPKADGVPSTAAGPTEARPETPPALKTPGDGANSSREAENDVTPSGGKAGGDGKWRLSERASEKSGGGSFPPVCVCGLHRTCSPFRIGMLNDQDRTAAFRSTIRTIFRGSASHHANNGGEKQQNNHPIASVIPGAKRRRAAGTVRVACVSDGFLLPLLSAQEGASEILELQPSAAYGAVCRDVYRANGIDADIENDDANTTSDEHRQRTIRPFPGGVSSVYDLLTPPSGSAFAADGSTFAGLNGKKLGAVIGEPFFADLSTAAWPLESLLLFWCARTALEAGGCFSPRTRVVPARARLVASPFACELLFRGRRRVGSVEGVDMSAVNGGLGLDLSSEQHRGRRGAEDGGLDMEEGGEGRRRPGEVESVRLSEFGHRLLCPAAEVLDMDLTRPLCDLQGGRTEIRCSGGGAGHTSTTAAAAAAAAASGERGETEGHVACHGVALWLDIWLDEEGHHRLSTGPEKLYWPQGVLFFDEEWLVPPCGRSFHLQASLQDGALNVDIS